VRSILAALVLLALACDPRTPPKEPPLPAKPAQPQVEARLQRDLEALALEAGIEPPDPPAPPGSLRDEIEAFVSLDACASRLATVDPLLGDALDAVGYEGLVRDACRLIEALSARDPKKCAPILASPLRHRCEADVATLVGDSNLCPPSGAGRDPLCLARARRDPRLCEALAPLDRPRCKAIVVGDVSACAGDAHCERRVQRWAPLFEPPRATEPFTTQLVVDVEDGDAMRAFDLEALSAQGAVVRKTKGRYEISLGAKPASSVIAAEARPAAGFFTFKLPIAPEMPVELPFDPASARFELLLPGFGLLTNAGAQAKGAFRVTDFAPEPLAKLSFEIEAKVVDGERVLPLHAKVRTFVRDVVER